MAFDAFYLSAVLGEVRGRCEASKVEKIYQPKIGRASCRERV